MKKRLDRSKPSDRSTTSVASSQYSTKSGAVWNSSRLGSSKSWWYRLSTYGQMSRNKPFNHFYFGRHFATNTSVKWNFLQNSVESVLFLCSLAVEDVRRLNRTIFVQFPIPFFARASFDPQPWLGNFSYCDHINAQKLGLWPLWKSKIYTSDPPWKKILATPLEVRPINTPLTFQNISSTKIRAWQKCAAPKTNLLNQRVCGWAL